MPPLYIYHGETQLLFKKIRYYNRFDMQTWDEWEWDPGEDSQLIERLESMIPILVHQCRLVRSFPRVMFCWENRPATIQDFDFNGFGLDLWTAFGFRWGT